MEVARRIEESIPIGEWIADPITWWRTLEKLGGGRIGGKRYIGRDKKQDGNISSHISYSYQDLLNENWNDIDCIPHYCTLNKMVKAEITRTYNGKRKTEVRMARTAKNVKEATYLYIDVDFKCKSESMEYFIEQVPKLPLQPQIILSSGRGIWLIFAIHPITDMEKWNHVEDGLIKAIGGEADNSATDTSRYCRIPGSVNQKSGQKVQFLVQTEEIYTIDEIVEAFNLPPMEEKKKPPKQEKKKPNKNGKVNRLFNLYNLNNTRCQDIITLIEMRGGDCEGCRENMLWLIAWHYTLANKEDITESILADLLTEVNEMFIDPLPISQINAIVRYTINIKDEKDDRGKPIFNYTNKRICSMVLITDEEVKDMQTILTEDEKRYRDKMRKRETRGSVSIEEHKQKLKDNKDEQLKTLSLLLGSGKNRVEIEQIMGISRRTFFRLKKEI